MVYIDEKREKMRRVYFFFSNDFDLIKVDDFNSIINSKIFFKDYFELGIIIIILFVFI